MDGARVSGTSLRQHDGADLSVVRAARVRRARRAIRELVAAARRHPRRAADDPLRDRGGVGDGRRQQRLHTDRVSRARGTRMQELDPHHRVREAPRGTGRRSRDRDSRSLPRAAASRADDVDRVHHGRAPARLLARCRHGDSPRDGHRGLRRHARRHPLRSLPHARLLHVPRQSRRPFLAPQARPRGSRRVDAARAVRQHSRESGHVVASVRRPGARETRSGRGRIESRRAHRGRAIR